MTHEPRDTPMTPSPGPASEVAEFESAVVTIEWHEAERLAGRRLDRRRAYAKRRDGSPCDISGSYVFELIRFTTECSGCDGGGCRECGHKGRSRHAQWVPLLSTEDD